MTATPTDDTTQQMADLERRIARTEARGAVENVFSTYMYLHNAFRDEEIIDLWVKPGTPGIRAQYSNLGVYTTWESVTAYHRGRPAPPGKLILHYTMMPVIEVAGDGETARGLWLMNGLESGLTDPAVAGNIPDFFFEPDEVDGKRVWAHWVWCEYGVDFLKQDGEWKIWHFRCLEIARATHSRNWIDFASRDAAAFDKDLMYFGEDGKPTFMPAPDGPATAVAERYAHNASQQLIARPPVPYAAFDDSMQY